MVDSKPFSPACERNREPILAQLKSVFARHLSPIQSYRLLEIGSGSGQHAVFFSARLKPYNILWQPSDLHQHLSGIKAWMSDEPDHNCLEPIPLDLASNNWPEGEHSIIFTSNTLHIVSWDLVLKMLQSTSQSLPIGGLFITYGPFKYAGEYTSHSNEEFDLWLKSRDPESGIRDIEKVQEALPGMSLLEDISMPANNQLLVFGKH